MTSTMAYNSTISSFDLPPLPSYTLTPRPSLINGVPDIVPQLLSPIVAYWVVSFFFQILDSYDLCSQYRLHTPAELTKRNRVSKYEVFRDVVLQQIIQTIAGLIMDKFEPPEMIGRENYDIAVWAQRLRRVQFFLPQALAFVGMNAPKLAIKVADRSPTWASVLAGGQYFTPGFAGWEMSVARFIYWVGVPAIQFTAAVIFMDAWQYFWHRAMHMNKFLYTTLHSRHHRLYVPYAFGALYNHPIEGFLLDTLSGGLGYMLTGMTVRQGLCFFTCSTIKTVDDHCGYAFPWDPLQHLTGNNAAYHDIHHQSWGIKTNFSQPFFTFWDRLLGTIWTGGDVSLRYERDRISAQKKVDADKASLASSVTNSPAVDLKKAEAQAKAGQQQVLEGSIDDPVQVLSDELREEQEAQRASRRSPRHRQSGFDAKALSGKVSGSLYGRSTPILHASTGN